MIIERFIQYLKLKNLHLDWIPKIKDGTCNALSFFYISKDMSDEKWHQFLNTISRWRGYENDLTPELETWFKTLEKYIEEHHFVQEQKSIFVGIETISQYLETCKKNNTPCVLMNPWHAIALRPSEKGWMVCDPNFDTGSQVTDSIEKTLIKRLGRLISVTNDVKVKLQFDALKFLEYGGLISLDKCENRDDILKQLDTKTLLNKIKDQFSEKQNEGALEGLWLRNTSYVPAWALCISDVDPRLKKLALDLLNLYRELFGDKIFDEVLSKSLNVLSEQQKSDYLNRLIGIEKTDTLSTEKEEKQLTSLRTKITVKETISPLVKGITQLAKISEIKANAEKQLTTWNKETKIPSSPKEFYQSMLTPATKDRGKKRLINLKNEKEAIAMQIELQKQAKTIHRPVFYVHSPDDLRCDARSIKRKKDRGEIQKPPSGPLYDFLTQKHDNGPPVLIVNYDKFDAEDIVSLNSLLDKERNVQGTKCPDDMLVIGLMNVNKPGCYREADFLSRFDEEIHCPAEIEFKESVTALPVKESLIQRPADKPQDVDETLRDVGQKSIPLYLGTDWKERLLGQWFLDKEGLYFQDGLLLKALENNHSTIVIQNGPWNDPEFVHFWQQACLHKKIVHSGGEIILPDNFTIIKSNQYDWQTLSQRITIERPLSYKSDVIVLNPGQIHSLFKHYDTQFVKGKGLIEKSQNKTLHVNMTSSLDEHQWAEILTECNKFNVTLEVHCAPFITIPSVLESKIKLSLESKEVKPATHTQIIQTNDIDVSVENLIADKSAKWEIIDISECTPADLLKKITAKFDDDKNQFHFNEKESALSFALRKKKNVILKGDFSPLLADGLMPLLLERLSEQSSTESKLVLISHHCDAFKALPMREHKITSKEKKELLLKQGVEEKVIEKIDLDKESLAQIKARLRYPNQSDDPWQGMLSLPSHIPLSEFNPATSAEDTKEFNDKRLKAVNAVLNSSPYVYLTGLTGVGKSTFISDIFSPPLKKANGQMYYGENELLNWANDQSKGKKILFIDEVNIGSKQWSEFEGLFNHPPTILIDGELHTLTDEHKIIFAGNPLSYGDERKQAALFQRHGNAVVFDPLPPALIYQDMLLPIFKGTPLEQHAPDISKTLLAVYQFLCQCSRDTVLISPRECEMMALMTLSYIYSVKETVKNPADIALYYAYQLAKPLVPESYQKEFEKTFPPPFLPIKLKMEMRSSDNKFVVTPSREKISQQLHEWFALREYRCTQGKNEKQKYGGLGGIVLEGLPGVGKSEIVIDTLRKRGYEELHQLKIEDSNTSYFMRIPVSLDMDQKKERLLWAFNHGVVVIMDEMNSSPMMERLLNSLLMGKTPEGKPPEKPGFMLIGTQNPATLGGRRKASTALSRRMHMIEVSDYPLQELTDILINNGVDKEYAKAMAEVYQKQLNTARQQQLKPPPTLRDLLRVAECYIDPNRLAMQNKQKEMILAKKSSEVVTLQDNPARLFAASDKLKENKNPFSELNHFPSSPKRK